MIIIEIAELGRSNLGKGFELLKEIRAGKVEGISRDLLIMALTRASADSYVFAGWQAGVDCYLTKPFNPKEVVHYCKTLLKPKADKITGEDKESEN